MTPDQLMEDKPLPDDYLEKLEILKEASKIVLPSTSSSLVDQFFKP